MSLTGRQIVLTRERGYNNDVARWLHGADCTEVPLTTTLYEDHEAVAATLKDVAPLGGFSTLVVTSPRVRDYLHLVRDVLHEDFDIASIGSASSEVLRAAGFLTTYEVATGADSLAQRITRGPVLSLGARVTRPELADRLTTRGIAHTHVVCYTTVDLAPTLHQQALLRQAEVVVIGAPSTWRVAAPYVHHTAVVVVPGPTTAMAVRADHERLVEAWGPDMAAAVVRSLG